MAEQITTAGFVELNLQAMQTSQGVSELNRMLRTLFQRQIADGQNLGIYKGYGTPENNVTADIGSLYVRLDGSTSTTLYVKESGTGDTGWVAK